MLQHISHHPVEPIHLTTRFDVYGGEPRFLERKQVLYGSGVRSSLFADATQDEDTERDCGKCYPRTFQTDPGRRSHSGHKSGHRMVSGAHSMHGQLITGMAPQFATYKARKDEMVAGGAAKLSVGRTVSAMPTKTHPSTTKRVPITPQVVVTKDRTIVQPFNSSKQAKMIDMSKFENRFESFHYPPKWEQRSLSNIDPTVLSSHGFWYTGQEDIVCCYACLIELSDWEQGMDVFARHFIASPNCSHLRQYHEQCILDLCKSQFISYKDFTARLESFHFAHWPLKGVASPGELANAGFFYLGKGSKTQCFSCGCMNEKWEAGVSALSVHKKIYSKCPFLLEIMSRASPSPLPSSPSRKLHATVKPALSPNYSSLEARVQSFKHYPADAVIEKDEFAEAGFYLLQLPSTVRCFACGLTESSWQRGDNPHKRHGQKSEDCPFLSGSSSPAPPLLPETHQSILPEPAFSVEELAKWFRVPSVTEPPQPSDDNHSYLYPSSCLEGPLDVFSGPSSMSEQSSMTEKGETGSAKRRASVHGFPRHSLETNPTLPECDKETKPRVPDTQEKEDRSIFNRPVCYPPSYRRRKKENAAGTNDKRTTNAPLKSQTPPMPNATVTKTTTGDSLTYDEDSENKLCIICFENPKEYALLPCGHLCLCQFCVRKLDSYCPVCRERVNGKARIFLT